MDTQDKNDKDDDTKLLERVKRRHKFMADSDHENRQEAMVDLKFVTEPGYQWDDNMKQERGQRPCYEFNKLRITGKRIINDIRANRPAGKVRAVEGGDKEMAEIREGLIRNIWNVSDAESDIDYACEFQVQAGMGAWRVDTEYSDDTMFDQDIVVTGIENPFCLYADPSCKDPQKRDAKDWILTEKIPYKVFEARYPDAEKANFEDMTEFDDDEDWQDEETVRVAEYWYKVPHKKEIWQLQDGTVVDSESDEAAGVEDQVVKRREVMTHKIMWAIVSGAEVLEGPSEWAGSMFPFIMVYGEYMVIDGKPCWWGLPRFAKDAQRSYNFARTAIAETIAQAPQAKWWATAKQSAGLTEQWAMAHKKNYPFLVYNADQEANGPPQRMGGADVPVALIQETQIASEEIKAVTGIFDASMGQTGNETSGRAIYARQQQGEIATFNYQDNIAKGVKLTYDIILDLMPHIYDTEREMRVLASDGVEDYKRINQVVIDPATGDPVTVNDMTSGRFDTVVTIGPNFSTQRQEAAETYGELGRQFPELMGVAGDLVFKSMDLPYAEDIAERLRSILPPQIQQMLDKDTEMSPEVMAAMAQAEQAMAAVQEQAQMVQQAAQEAQEDISTAKQVKAEVKAELANIKTAKAEFDAHMAKEVSNLVQREAGLTVKDATLESKGADLKIQSAEVEARAGDADNTETALDLVGRVDSVLSQFMQQVDDAMGEIVQKGAELEQKANRTPVGGTVNRQGGKLTADVQFDDGTSKQISAVRQGGQLRIVADSEPESEA